MAKGLKGWGAAKGGLDKGNMAGGRATSGGKAKGYAKGGKVEGGACMSQGGVVKPAGIPKQ